MLSKKGSYIFIVKGINRVQYIDYIGLAINPFLGGLAIAIAKHLAARAAPTHAPLG